MARKTIHETRLALKPGIGIKTREIMVFKHRCHTDRRNHKTWFTGIINQHKTQAVVMGHQGHQSLLNLVTRHTQRRIKGPSLMEPLNRAWDTKELVMYREQRHRTLDQALINRRLSFDSNPALGQTPGGRMTKHVTHLQGKALTTAEAHKTHRRDAVATKLKEVVIDPDRVGTRDLTKQSAYQGLGPGLWGHVHRA